MPNHVHLCLREKLEHGISAYMHKISTAYARYFNIRHDFKGHLFQGSFKAVHIGDNEQMTYLSAYIHRNPRDIDEWHGREEQYPWSSYQDYLSENRWGRLLQSDIILSQYKDEKEYQKFVDTSVAKT